MRSVARERQMSRIKRHRRIRKNLKGTPERPRLAVYRSHQHIYTQIVDDAKGTTLVGASSRSPELVAEIKGKPKSEVGRVVGKLIAERAVAKGIKQIRFDRGGYGYHGRIKALAEAARKAGLEF